MNHPNTSTELSQYWRAHIDACQDAGESGAAYCKRHQLAYHRFIYWRQKFRVQNTRTELAPHESSGFVRVAPTVAMRRRV